MKKLILNTANALFAVMQLTFACPGFASSTPEADANGLNPVLVDDEVATAYAMAVLTELSEKETDGKVPISELDLNDPALREATDVTERTYVFVAFERRTRRQSGFYVVLEYCSGRFAGFSPRYAGFTVRLADELTEFLAVANDPNRDFPGECLWWVP